MEPAAPEAESGQPGEQPPAVEMTWPLPGCGPDSLADLSSARTLAVLAGAAAAGGGAVALDLAKHVLRAPGGPSLHVWVPPAGLRSLALRNGTLELQPGTGVEVG